MASLLHLALLTIMKFELNRGVFMYKFSSLVLALTIYFGLTLNAVYVKGEEVVDPDKLGFDFLGCTLTEYECKELAGMYYKIEIIMRKPDIMCGDDERWFGCWGWNYY